jgi:hypothetical protein
MSGRRLAAPVREKILDARLMLERTAQLSAVVGQGLFLAAYLIQIRSLDTCSGDCAATSCAAVSSTLRFSGSLDANYIATKLPNTESEMKFSAKRIGESRPHFECLIWSHSARIQSIGGLWIKER